MNPEKSDIGSTKRLARRLKARIRVPAEALIRAPLRLLFWSEQRERPSGAINELSFMYAFLFKHFARICPSRVLDVGTGTSSLPHLMSHCGAGVIAIDKFRGYWGRRPLNRHFQVTADDICSSRIRDSFDLITCVGVIQHVPGHLAAMQTMARLLRPGGSLVVCFFYNEEQSVPDVYRLSSSNAFGHRRTYGCQILSRREVDEWVRRTGLRVVDRELWDCFTGEYWSMGERRQPPRLSSPAEPHHVACICLEKARDAAESGPGEP
jgi:SAM-dependent methyltransferase